jgi:DNA-binding transcriptional regulator YiaG
MKWVAISGYEGRYEISEFGDVRSLRCRHGARVFPIKQVIASDGYLAVSLFDGIKAKTHPVHVLVAREFIGPRPVGFDINHMSGVKHENHAANLEYCTRSENMKHAVKHGLRLPRQGEKHHGAKLTNEQVFLIRELLSENASGDEVARIMNITKSTVSNIKHGRTWSHAPAPSAVGA